MCKRIIRIRTFEPRDAETVSALIRRTMRESNSHDYPLDRLQPLIDYFSPEKVRQLGQERVCLVAEANGVPIGTAALDDAELATFFVLPEYQGQGIGTRLLAAIEQQAWMQGIMCITVDASLTCAEFYARMGYRRTGVECKGTAGVQISMAKLLPSRVSEGPKCQAGTRLAGLYGLLGHDGESSAAGRSVVGSPRESYLQVVV
jgi:GNAT superfamily N-acetyltransferase